MPPPSASASADAEQGAGLDVASACIEDFLQVQEFRRDRVENGLASPSLKRFFRSMSAPESLRPPLPMRLSRRAAVRASRCRGT